MKVCTNCDESNADDAMFCAACNHFLEWTDVARIVPVAGSGPAPADDGTPGPPTRLPPLPTTFPARQPAQPQTDRPRVAQPPVDGPATTRPPTGSRPPAGQSTDRPAVAPPVPPPPALSPPAVPAPAVSPPAVSPPAVPAPEPAAAASGPTPAPAVAKLERSRELAASRGRADLIAQIDSAKAELDQRLVSVIVVGEFKKGKSTLVNALLHTAVCPADADLVTVVPTVVRYGAQPKAFGYVEPTETGAEPDRIDVPIDRIADFASESGNPANRKQLRSVEVLLAHRMLRTGLSMVDTPGAGGLESAHGVITMSALDLADAVLFVTDASTELTAPELDFLRRALQRCPLAACVVTKTDLYPQWRRIVDLDRKHLADAGIDLPVIPVSSFLRLAARRDKSLNAESGYADLVEFLAGSVMPQARSRAAETAATAAGFVAAQIDREVSAERAVLEQPDQAGAVVARLRTAAGRAAALASPNATWQQVLGDGLQELVADVEHDLAERLRTVLRDVEGAIDDGDPKEIWDGIGIWLQRQVAEAAVANFDTLAASAAELAAEVGQRFALEAGDPVHAAAGAVPEALGTLSLASAETLNAPGGRFGALLMSTRTAMFVPMVLFGVAGSLLGAFVVAPIGVALAAGIGRKMIKDEQKRQVAYRRQQAKNAARKYVEEVGFVMNKETRDALRRTGRQLRDEFTQRAATIHRSSVGALSAAEKAQTLSGAERSERAAALQRQSDTLAEVRKAS